MASKEESLRRAVYQSVSSGAAVCVPAEAQTAAPRPWLAPPLGVPAAPLRPAFLVLSPRLFRQEARRKHHGARRPGGNKSTIWAAKMRVRVRDAVPALTQQGLERWRRLEDPAPSLPR